jgi:hypothetical protein
MELGLGFWEILWRFVLAALLALTPGMLVWLTVLAAYGTVVQVKNWLTQSGGA